LNIQTVPENDGEMPNDKKNVAFNGDTAPSPRGSTVIASVVAEDESGTAIT
jgi:hypothetical protein